MDNCNWRPSPAPQGVGGGTGASGPAPGGVGGGDAPATDAVDWRSELSAESRDRIVNKIMETLTKHRPVSGPEELSELKKIAVRFEERIYHVASSQSDYLRKISMKMVTMETKSQNTIPNAMPSNSNDQKKMMDNCNWRPSPAPQGVGGGAGASGPVPGGVGGEDAPATDAVDWRSELSAESRDRIVDKIMETLKKRLPVSGPEGLSELKKIAVRFEERIYHVASSQSDYLRKISMKLLTMETKTADLQQDLQ